MKPLKNREASFGANGPQTYLRPSTAVWKVPGQSIGYKNPTYGYK